MNTEDDEFNRIEREATLRLEAVSAALLDHRERMQSLTAAWLIPDAMTTSEGEHHEYVAGWNDCREAMLRGGK
jgi:hypothetical protein